MAAAARQGPYRPLALAAARPWTNSTSPTGRVVYPAIADNYSSPWVSRLSEGKQASITELATWCFSRWAQRRGRQFHRFQYRGKHRARVAYLLAADIVSGPLPSRLREAHQPVIITRNRFSR